MMEFVNLGDATLAAQYVAIEMFRTIQKQSEPKLGLATGGTMEPVYKSLVQLIEHNPIDLSALKTFNLDEYYGLDKDHPQSYLYFMKHHLFNHIDITENQYYFPDNNAVNLEADNQAYDQLVKSPDGVHLQILGIGTNGHIGFNEPGTPFDSNTRLVQLTDETIQANARFFNHVEEVPTRAVTMGIKTIMSAERIILLAVGKKKQPIIHELYHMEIPDTDVPASVLLTHPDVLIVTDNEAAPQY